MNFKNITASSVSLYDGLKSYKLLPGEAVDVTLRSSEAFRQVMELVESATLEVAPGSDIFASKKVSRVGVEFPLTSGFKGFVGRIVRTPSGKYWIKSGNRDTDWEQLLTDIHEGVDGGSLIDLPSLPMVHGVAIHRAVSPGTTEEVVLPEEPDRIYTRNTSVSSVYDYDLSIDWKGVSLPETAELSWVSSDPSKATVDQEGRVTYVAPGAVTIRCQVPSLNLSLPIHLMMGNFAEVFDTFNRFAEGSAAKDATDAVDTRIAGTDRDVARHLYVSFPFNSTYTDEKETRGNVDEFIRNPDFWAADIDLSCISPSYVRGGETTHRRSPTATAISPWHWISCMHSSFHPPVNSKVYFVQMDGTLVYRTTVAKQNVGDHDLTVGLFDAALPVGVVPAKILPSSWNGYMSKLEDIPGLLLDQQEHGMVHDLWRSDPYVNWKYPLDLKRKEFVDQPEDNRVWDSSGIEYYDSGNPSFIIINDALVLLTVWAGGFRGSGTSITKWSSLIQETMDSLSSANGKPQTNLTFVDLSNFNEY
jgi:hypothetical protein